ncbi:MAG: hypothetical protein R2788_16360 [Saprospiraceae bacterium]
MHCHQKYLLEKASQKMNMGIFMSTPIKAWKFTEWLAMAVPAPCARQSPQATLDESGLCGHLKKPIILMNKKGGSTSLLFLLKAYGREWFFFAEFDFEY